MKIFEGVHAILLDPSSSLQGLAQAVGQHPEELFEGESFSGVDLRDEPIDLLLRIDADYQGAILTRTQTKALNEGRSIRAQRIRKAKIASLQNMRFQSMREFVDRFFQADQRTYVLNTLWAPLQDALTPSGSWDASTRYYAVQMLRFLARENVNFQHDMDAVILSFMLRLKMMKLPLEAGVLSVLFKLEVDVSPGTFEKVIDFNSCTEEFVTTWLDYVAAHSRSDRSIWFKNTNWSSTVSHVLGNQKNRDAYFDALTLSIVSPTSPPFSYYESILSRARSPEELKDLVRVLSATRLDRPLAALAARLLSQSVSEGASIKQIALDETIDIRIRDNFRSLIIASNSPTGRKALIEIIAEKGKRASGIEVDSILMGLNFDESTKFMKPYWSLLSDHHRAVALDAIEGKAANEDHRHAVARIRNEIG